jgi:hypothetical protein
MELPKESKECAFHIDVYGKKDICMEDVVIDELTLFAKNVKKLKVTNKKDTVNKLKVVLDCQTESCILTKQEVKDVIGHDVANNQLEKRFKPVGPFDSDLWFSNVNIDKVLDQITIKYQDKKFLHIEFQMRDFEKVGGSLSKINLSNEYLRGIRCFGVVFNTDYSSGNGQHWFAIYGDFNTKPFTIEYFNSTGSDPLPEIMEWMKKTKHSMEKTLNKPVNDVVVSKIINQSDNHSCGSYSLYYIISRLENIPYKHFSKNKIGDNIMHEFRRNHLFRQSKSET